MRLRVALHDAEVGADERREVDLVDHEEVGARDAGAALARDLLAGGHVDHVDREVGELGAEGRGEVVAAALDQAELAGREEAAHARDGGEVDRGVLADRGVRAAAGLDALDALRRRARRSRVRNCAILARVDVVRDDGELVARRAARRRASRRARSCPSRPGRRCRREAGRVVGHERNSLVYWVSCCMEQDLRRRACGAEVVERGGGAAAAPRRGPASSAATTRWPADWPSGTSRTPAETRFAKKRVQVERERAARERARAPRTRRPPRTGRTGATPLPRPAPRSPRAAGRPGVSDGAEEGRALHCRLERELCARPERLRELRHFEQSRALHRRAEAAREEHRLAARRCRSASSSPSQRRERALVARRRPSRPRAPARASRRTRRSGTRARATPRARVRAGDGAGRGSVVQWPAAVRAYAPRLRLERRLDLAHAPAEAAQHVGDHVVGPDADRRRSSSAGTCRFPMCQASRSRRCGSPHVTSSSGSGAAPHGDPGARPRCGARRPPRARRPSAGRAAAPRPRRSRDAGGGGAGDRSRA